MSTSTPRKTQAAATRDLTKDVPKWKKTQKWKETKKWQGDEENGVLPKWKATEKWKTKRCAKQTHTHTHTHTPLCVFAPPLTERAHWLSLYILWNAIHLNFVCVRTSLRFSSEYFVAPVSLLHFVSRRE